MTGKAAKKYRFEGAQMQCASNGETYVTYPVLRGDKIIQPPPLPVSELTGEPKGRYPKYPLKYMEVGDYFVVQRLANEDPTYDSLRVYLINCGKRMNAKFSIVAAKFPDLVVERVK